MACLQIILNGEKKSFTAPLDLQALLAREGYKNAPVAVAVNSEFIPKAHYKDTALKDSDDIEILAPMQGG